MEIDGHLFGSESQEVAYDQAALSHALEYTTSCNSDESICLLEHAIAIFARVEGRLCVNVAMNERYLGLAYETRAKRINDQDQRVIMLNLALLRYHEALRIYQVLQRHDKALEVERGEKISVNPH